MDIRLLPLLLLTLVLWGCQNKSNKEIVIPEATMLTGVREVVDFSKLEPFFHKKTDSVYLINFWATTCPPCLKELPWFETLASEFEHEKLRMLFINTDGKSHLEDRLFPFLERRKIDLPMVALTDPNANKWTEAVNPNWYGALPYTIIYNKQKRAYYFGAFDNYEHLKQEVFSFLKEG